MLRSYKGKRRKLLAEQARKPRHRSGKAAKRSLSDEQVPILVLRNRAGQTTDHVLEVANKRCVAKVKKPALADDAVCVRAPAACSPPWPANSALSTTP